MNSVPWKLILFVCILVFGVVFIGLNLDNKVVVSFGFVVFQNVPVFFALFIAFVFGALSSLPFKIKRKKTEAAPKNSKAKAETVDEASSP